MIGAVMGPDTFVGREAELATLREGARAAADGAGGVWLVAGEPGVGKSRLLEELAREVGATHAVVWGRAWEEGGAPPYWPWVQVLRAAMRRREIGEAPFVAASRAPWLGQLVAELAQGAAPPPALEPAAARFRLLDAVASALTEAAERRPLLVLFEDLHAIDASSAELLAFLAREIRAARVAVVGTLREAEARRGPSADALARIAREARRLTLERLGREPVAAYLAGALGSEPPDTLVDAVLATTEGNALFLSEIARAPNALARLARGDGEKVIPPSVEAAIRERVGALAPDTRALLETASAFGREVRGEALGAVVDLDRRALATALAEATDHALLVEAAPDVYRFTHILVRDALHDALASERRASLHAAIAATLAARAPAPWPRIAQHALEAGAAGRALALDALERAGAEAADALAFTEAATHFAQALELARADGLERVACALCIGLASALRHGGDLGGARRVAGDALDRARRLGEPDLFAAVVLELGGALDVGATNAELVALLEEALDGLPPGDGAPRARLMARLAAAMQPAIPPEPAFEQSRRAIAMARRTGEPAALLETLRTGIAALMDLADPRERTALNREHAALATRMGAPIDALLAHGRLVFDAAELGEPSAVHAAIDACTRIVDEHALGAHRWRVTLLRAMCATIEGRFADAEALADEAEREATRASEPWAARSVLMQRHFRARLRGDADRAHRLLEPIDAQCAGFELGRQMTRLMRVAALGWAGRREAAAALWDDALLTWPLGIGDLSLLELATDAVLCLERPELTGRVLARLRPEAHRHVSWGILGATIGPPAGALVGRLLVALGDAREGEQHLREAHARAIATGCRPYAGWIACWLAELPDARDRDERGAEALAIAEALDMPGLAARARALGPDSAPRAASPAVDAFRMRREGGVWVLERDGRSLHLRDLKGLHLLARLVEARGAEVHVLDLDSPTGEAAPGAGSDAGEVLDAKAREAYRRRVAALREELAEAEQWNDAGRAERARRELDAIAGELARAVGLGGRARRAKSGVERARVNVQRRLKDAIARVEAQDAALGRHLARSIRTGTYCRYEPE
ncbi:MAG: AAA family ATPase [Sandaracinaceae bacterium]|nr:AAA family ATPase [Sandaracinaceae bacterium]